MNALQRLCWTLFRWEYVSLEYGGTEICRVRYMPNGLRFVKCYGIKYEATGDGYTRYVWTWLTPKKEDVTPKLSKGALDD